MDAKLQERAEQLATEFAAGASSMAELNALLQTMRQAGAGDNAQRRNGPSRGPTKPRRKSPQQPAGQTAAGGRSTKKLLGDFGKIEVQTPRDRQATFEP